MPPTTQSCAVSGRPSDTTITMISRLPALPKCAGHTCGWRSWCLKTTPASISVSGMDNFRTRVSASVNNTSPTSTRKL
ncbi:hypothetical protein D3C87_1776970 [compost metagenome]